MWRLPAASPRAAATHLIFKGHSDLAYQRGVDALENYLSFLKHTLLHHGEVKCVKVAKEVNSRARMFVAGYPNQSVPYSGVWGHTHKDGLPRSLGKLAAFIREFPDLGLLITNLYTLFRLEPDTDISTITNEYKGSLTPKDFRSFLEFLNKTAPRLDPSVVGPVPSVRGGPNESIAILGAAADAVALGHN